MSSKAEKHEHYKHQAAITEAREDFYFFARYMFQKRKGFKWLRNWHHLEIANALHRVYLGLTSRLIINIPPRYTKTELAVVNFIAWTLGKHPDAEFIHTSYSGKLASNNSWHAREIVEHAAYRKIFPEVNLRTDSNAKDDWRTEAGGIVYSAGMGGTITGYGAGKHRKEFGGAILIDDPHKPDDASSAVKRQGVLDWYNDTLQSRVNSPQTPIVLIMQRLHEMDLSGFLLAGGSGEKWDHLCIPAINAKGEALWSEKHDIKKLRQMEKAMPYGFAGQYQQTPSPIEGGLFKPYSITTMDAVPSGLRMVRRWDLAATADDGDWTVGVKMGADENGRFGILDVVRFQGGPHEVEDTIVKTAQRDGIDVKVSLPQDPGQAGKHQVAYYTGKLAGYTVESAPETGDKVTRASPFASQVNVGNIWMVRAAWNDEFISELKLFPNAAHDDQVDAAAGAFNSLSGKPIFFAAG